MQWKVEVMEQVTGVEQDRAEKQAWIECQA